MLSTERRRTRRTRRTRVIRMTITTTEVIRDDVNEYVQIEVNENVDTVNPMSLSLSHATVHVPLSTNTNIKKMKLNVVHISSVLSNWSVPLLQTLSIHLTRFL
jgi:hypothetical protein